MIFVEKSKIGHELGLSSMLCERISKYILLYGGSNFPDGTPPNGTRKVHNMMYLYDMDFKLISKKEGKISPDSGILIKDDKNDKIYWISGMGNNKIYEYSIENGEITENEIYDLGFEIVSGYGCIYNEKLYFGNENVYEYNLKTKELMKKANFPANVRNQSIYFEDNGYIYVLGGLSDICYLDSYKYSILDNKWIKISDTPINLSGAAFSKNADGKVIIVGGCNKEIYDDAVKNLHDIEYKKEYFKKTREDFKFNQKIYMFDPKIEKYELLGEGNIENARCGAVLLQINSSFYLVNGEIKPGYRTSSVLEGVMI